MLQAQSALGLVALLLLAWSLGEERRLSAWRIAVTGAALQIVLAALMLYLPGLGAAVAAANRVVAALDAATGAGTSLVFGYLGGAPLPFEESFPGAAFVLAFRALPIILVVSALAALLTHWRILPLVVRGFGPTKVEVTSQWQPEGRSEKEVLIGFVAQLSSTRGVIDCGTEEVVFSPGSGVCANGYKPFVNDRVSVSLLYQDGERMVNEVRPLREKSMTASVSSVLQGYGTIEEDIYFSFFSCARGYRPRVGDSVRVVCVEYQHQKSNWRALSVEPMSTRPEGKRSDVSCGLLAGILAMTQLRVLPTILGPIRELHSSNKQRKALVLKTSIFVKFINKTLF